MNRLQDPVAFPAWAYRIVSNKCHDWIRSECRRRKGQGAYAEARVIENNNRPHQEDEHHESLFQALGRLPSRDLALLALKYQEGFATSQIAEALGIPEGTVRSRLYYLHNRIRNMLKEVNP